MAYIAIKFLREDREDGEIGHMELFLRVLQVTLRYIGKSKSFSSSSSSSIILKKMMAAACDFFVHWISLDHS
jgi:hypothetical protein